MFAERCRAGSCCAAPPSSDVQAVAWWRHVIAGVVGAMALVAVATAASAVCANQYVPELHHRPLRFAHFFQTVMRKTSALYDRNWRTYKEHSALPNPV